MKKPIIQSMGDFLAGRGFYIVLFLCVAAVGVSGWYLMEELPPSLPQPVAGTAVVESPSPSVSVTQPVVTPTAKPSAAPKPTPSATPNSSEGPAATGWGAQVFSWPVKGEVIGDFSLEVLAYDETMGDWRTHDGLDIAAEVGTKVKAVNAGKVTEIFRDDLMGTVVTVEHEDGLISLYANLMAQPNVKVGDVLDTGDVLGAVGETAIAEISKPAHLHFEMSKGGKAVDPIAYLPQ